VNYVCIHGHFYQPPRENPWLETIEWQEDPYPFHDWNERITAECYGPNAWSRILDDHGRIAEIVNNYARISFNFGPTLLSWMEDNAPAVYQRVLDGDRSSMARFGGHGSAIAQAYNHLIMPLARPRIKRLQVEWGIRDFQRRFGRDPLGMWLPETAVDKDTLEVLAANGILFTLLAPRQAKSVRKAGESVWHDVSGNQIDPRKAYRCQLSGNRHIDLFFYDGGLAQDVAFKRLLDDGSRFAQALLHSFGDANGQARLVHVATDGESYGHHHRYGDMGLAYALDRIEGTPGVQLTNYAQFLSLHPPKDEVEIVPRSSWSCMHGVERWRSDCGCRDGAGGDAYTLAWRSPLREALDGLSDQLHLAWERMAPDFFRAPEEAASEYLDLIHDRSHANVDAFLSRHALRDLSPDEVTRGIRLLEMLRQGMLMYTSCAWFFDDIARVEPVQILRYANRAMQIAEGECGLELEEPFVARLREAPCNHPQYANGAEVYEKLVAPSRLTLSRVGMHYAVYSLFEDFPEQLEICNYSAISERYERFEAGLQRLALGRTMVRSRVTRSVKHFSFAVIYLGQHQIIGQLDSEMEAPVFESMFEQIREAFLNSRTAEVLGIMQRYFNGSTFSFWNLFRDEQRKVLEKIVAADLLQAENAYREIFDRNYNIMNVLQSADMHIPDVFSRNLEVVINTEIRKSFENGPLNPRKLEKLDVQARKWNVPLDKKLIAFAAGKRLLTALEELPRVAEPVQHLDRVNRVFQVLRDLEIHPDLWQLQNEYYQLSLNIMPDNILELPEFQAEWERLGELLGVSAPLFRNGKGRATHGNSGSAGTSGRAPGSAAAPSAPSADAPPADPAQPADAAANGQLAPPPAKGGSPSGSPKSGPYAASGRPS
jgi:alpha-amylase/alpha-mannosidase (GH57 family)